MGKKLAIGCGSVFLVLLLAGAGVAWYYIGRPAGELIGSVRDVQRIESIREGVRAAGPYQAPEDRVLSDGQIERYLAVQDAMRDRLEGRAVTLRERYEEIDAREGDPTPGELMRAWSDATGLLVEAAEAQVDALNEHGFSVDEYHWVRARVLEAAGFAAPGFDLSELASGEVEGSTSEERAGAVPPENAARIEPLREKIEETLPLAWFGL